MPPICKNKKTAHGCFRAPERKLSETVKERVNDAGARAVIKLPREERRFRCGEKLIEVAVRECVGIAALPVDVPETARVVVLKRVLRQRIAEGGVYDLRLDEHFVRTVCIGEKVIQSEHCEIIPAS